MSFNLDYRLGTLMHLEIFVAAKVKLRNARLQWSLSRQGGSGREVLSSLDPDRET
jgi:hypothetical protein